MGSDAFAAKLKNSQEQNKKSGDAQRMGLPTRLPLSLQKIVQAVPQAATWTPSKAQLVVNTQGGSIPRKGHKSQGQQGRYPNR